MKALSLWQPWASLIAHGIKDKETRSQGPPKGLIGQRIAIHAAKTAAGWRGLDQATWDGIEKALLNWRPDYVQGIGRYRALTEGFPRGAVVATAKLARSFRVGRVMKVSTDPNNDERFAVDYIGTARVRVDPYGDFSPGRWLWFLEDIEIVDPPIPTRGRQWLWEWKQPQKERRD